MVRAGSDVSVTVAGQVISFTWNANELTGSAPFLGTNVECKVVGTKSGGSPGARNTVEAGAVEWNSDQDSSQTLSPTGIASSAALGAPTVALVPFTALSEVRFPENGGYIGPFHPSASAHYVVGLGPGLQSIHMLKTTSAAPADGDWDEQDTGIQLTSLSDCKHIWAQMNSAETLIEVMTSQDDGVIRRHSYTISSDTWTTSNELAAEVSATPTDPYS